jgi:predicted component of type VI protein secretion system
MAISFKITPPGAKEKHFEISLDMEKILIGRGAPCDVRLPDASVSYHHATILMVETSYCLLDKNSKNGTYLNGKRLLRGKRYTLSTGDEIRICGFRITVNLSVPLAETFSAEKTDILAREIFLSAMAGEEEKIILLEIKKGSDAGKIHEIPPGRKTITVGTSDDCDVRINEKKVKDFGMEINLTPSGWRINEDSIFQARRFISYPARGKLHDEDEITIGGTRICFHDPVDRSLSDLRSKKGPEIQNGEEDLPPEPASPAEAGETKETMDERERKKPQTLPEKKPAAVQQLRQGKSEIREKYAAEYRIAAIAFGIIAFLLSLLLLILVLF